MTRLTRRDILKFSLNSLLGTGTVLTVGGLLRFLGYQAAPPPPEEFDLGPAENYPLGSSTVIVAIPAIVYHTSDGFWAIGLKCTHLGCTVENKNDMFICPCHGSRFDNKGRRTRGPATRDLSKLRVEQNGNGGLTLFMG
jgi:nitrite reductase/ring-hydroxylating ferredoxin subunit